MTFQTILNNIENIETKNEFLSLLNKVSDEYYNSNKSSLSDAEFDTLVSIYEKRFNEEYSYIGSRGDVKLPVFMPSLNKVKDNHALSLYKKRCDTDSYVVSDKIDGLSLLVVVKNGNVKLYTRGDGEYGKDVTNIYEYIDIGKATILQSDHIVRGEIVMPLDKFKNYSDTYNNPRNLVAGVINSKEKNPSILKNLKFIAYSYYTEQGLQSTDDTFKLLKFLGYYVPYFEVIKNIKEDNLREILNKRKAEAEYEIDGIVISSQQLVCENSKENPKFTVAFKSLGETKEVKVLDVEWNVRKYNYLKPRVKTEPVYFGNVKVQYFSGYNAKYIKDNNIGVGTVLLVTRSGDVVPDILSVVTPTEALMPKEDCHWSSSGLELISDENNSDINLINRLVSFFTVCNIKGMKDGIIKKIVEGRGIKDENEFFCITKDDVLSVDGFKDKSSENVISCINELKGKICVQDIMVACGIFQGFGEKKIHKIISEVGDVLPYCVNDKIVDKKDLISKILRIGGFNTTAEKFVNHLDEFKEYYNRVKSAFGAPKSIVIPKVEITGKIYCFSGFRDAKLKVKLMDEGNFVVDTLTKEVNILVVKDINDTSSKIEKARKYGIEIVELKKLI
uniref:DNA ligase (NAD(+)) n=1 Tax=viral metagenome TaxID=1070528 RepID=A0A6C0DK38_9ZZZZ